MDASQVTTLRKHRVAIVDHQNLLIKHHANQQGKRVLSQEPVGFRVAG